jgi:hypothetical protein
MHYIRETEENKFDGSVVGKMTRLRFVRFVVRIPTAERHFSLPKSVLTRSGAHPVSYSMGIMGKAVGAGG